MLGGSVCNSQPYTNTGQDHSFLTRASYCVAVWVEVGVEDDRTGDSQDSGSQTCISVQTSPFYSCSFSYLAAVSEANSSKR